MRMSGPRTAKSCHAGKKASTCSTRSPSLPCTRVCKSSRILVGVKGYLLADLCFCFHFGFPSSS